jgi:hypothetical protein
MVWYDVTIEVHVMLIIWRVLGSHTFDKGHEVYMNLIVITELHEQFQGDLHAAPGIGSMNRSIHD